MAASPEQSPPPRPTYLRVILIRHGQSGNNALVESAEGWPAYYARRSPDAALTPTGAHQARRAGLMLLRLAREMPLPLTRIFTSGMTRALQTASLAYEAAAAAAADNDDSSVGTAASQLHLPLPRPEVFVDTCEVGGLFDRRAGARDGDHSDGAWRGVGGLTRVELAAHFPLVAAGPTDAPPIALPAGCASFSCGMTLGAVTERGWWLTERKESELEGAARTARIVQAFRERARALLPLVESASTSASEASPLTPAASRLALQGIGVTPDGAQSRQHGGEAFALVCHGDFINCFLRCAAGELALDTLEAQLAAPVSSTAETDEGRADGDASVAAAAIVDDGSAHGLQFCSNNGSFSVVDFVPSGSIRIVRVNDCRHLLGAAASGNTERHVASAATTRGELLTGAPL